VKIIKKQKKKKAGAVAKGVKPSRQQQPIKNRGSSAVKLASVVEDDHEPCAMCSDASDPKKKDNWEKSTCCKRRWYVTCAALSGMYNREMFSCDECISKKKKEALGLTIRHLLVTNAERSITETRVICQ